MRAVLINDDKSLSLREVPDPVIKDDELLIKVMASGVNRADLLQREGNYPSPAGCPEWMGLEISGTVEKMGAAAAEKSGFKLGDRVCALMGGGGYADFAAVRYDMVLPLPENFDFTQGACIPEVYCTAYLNLFHEAALQKGETLLVFAGASGVGIAATQIAKAMGAKVIVTVRSDEKAEEIRKFGADVIVNTKKTDIEKVFADHPVNVVLDCVAGEQLGKCFTKMARRGRWIMIATLSGTSATIDLRALLAGGFCLKGSTLRSRTPEFKAQILSEVREKLYPYFESEAVKPEIYATFPFEQPEKAQSVLYANKNIGKVILTH